jgi:hypothetical protein
MKRQLTCKIQAWLFLKENENVTDDKQTKGGLGKITNLTRDHKVRNCSDLLGFMCLVTCVWKALNEGYNFSLYLTSIRGLHKKLWASKVARILISRISGFPTWAS